MTANGNYLRKNQNVKPEKNKLICNNILQINYKMSLRSLEQVYDEIESLQNKLELLKMEKKIINFCQQYNISDSKHKKITCLLYTSPSTRD